MKQLIVWCKIQDEFGNDVRGHISRTNDVVMALEEIAEQHIDRTNVFSYKDYLRAIEFYGVHNVVSIIDNGDIYFDENIPYHTLLITDEPFIEVEYQPMVINAPSKSIEIFQNRYEVDDPQHIVYTGLKNSIVSPLLNHYSWNPSKNKSAYLISGGAYELFMQKYNDLGIKTLLEEYGYNIIPIINYPRQKLLETVSRADLVVCSASVVSLELMTIGVPFISIQTSPDQTPYIKMYRKNKNMVTDTSSLKDIGNFIWQPNQPPMLVNKNHVYKLATHLHNMLMERN